MPAKIRLLAVLLWQFFMDITILLLLFALHGFLALGEAALITAKRTKLESDKARGRKGAATAAALQDSGENFFLTIRTGTSLLLLIEGAFVGVKFGSYFVPAMSGFAMLEPYAAGISMALAIIMAACIAMVIGELAPKHIAVRYAEALAIALAPPLRVVGFLLRPISVALNFLTKLALRLFFVKPQEAQHISEEEIKQMVRMANQQGVLETKESEFIQNILRFADRDAYSVMTHRNDLVWLDIHAPAEETDEIVRESGYTKFLVCDGDLENIVGVLRLRDYIDNRHKPGFTLQNILAPPLYVPETMNALKILERFRKERNYFAVIVDEYGSLQGIITLHDLTENIFGALPDVDDVETPAIIFREDGSLLVEGSILIDELRETISLVEFDSDDADYATLAGFILHKLSEIPREGDFLDTEGYRFEIVDMDKSKIDKVLIFKNSTRN
ncbi:MAG: hemolysin family protein [Saprospiraceae bacterium]